MNSRYGVSSLTMDKKRFTGQTQGSRCYLLDGVGARLAWVSMSALALLTKAAGLGELVQVTRPAKSAGDRLGRCAGAFLVLKSSWVTEW